MFRYSIGKEALRSLMASQNKIVKYQFEDMVQSLAATCTTMEISHKLTDELVRRGIEDSISQPTVARYLQRIRKERSEQTRELVHEHLKAEIPKDLEALDEIEAFFLAIFRNQVEDPETGDLKPGDFSLADRSAAGMKAKVVIETKLRFSGVLEEGGGENAAIRRAREIEEELDQGLLERIDEIGSGNRTQPVSGTH